VDLDRTLVIRDDVIRDRGKVDADRHALGQAARERGVGLLGELSMEPLELQLVVELR
jgi:hypothetical protein